MRTRKLLALAVSAATAIAIIAGPASAQTSDVTFELVAGTTFTISAPATNASIASGPTGSTNLAGQLGAVTVTDERGELVADWQVQVTATDFSNITTGGTTANEIVPNETVSYASGLATSTTGTGVFVPSTTAVTLDEANTALGAAWDGVGNNTATWNPTLTFLNTSTKVAGEYNGDVTHSLTAVLTAPSLP